MIPQTGDLDSVMSSLRHSDEKYQDASVSSDSCKLSVFCFSLGRQLVQVWQRYLSWLFWAGYGLCRVVVVILGEWGKWVSFFSWTILGA